MSAIEILKRYAAKIVRKLEFYSANGETQLR